MISKKRIYEIIERAGTGDRASKYFDLFIIILILLNTVAVIASSFTNFSIQFANPLKYFEFFSIVIFTVEYILRIWTATLKYPTGTKLPRIRYLFSLVSIIDLLAILPFWLPFVVNVDLRFLRLLRISRMIRLFKLNRYSDALMAIGRVIKNEKEKLISSMFVTFIMILIASSGMYYIENAAQPDEFPNIVATIWWAVATLTTVGYGDVYPITTLGKILAGLIAILGIGLVALPTGIIGSGFMKEIEQKKTVCPYCGKEIE
jgi:voltage-gated potassium channel